LLIAASVNLEEIRKDCEQLKTEVAEINKELDSKHFQDLDRLQEGDRYPSVMFPFARQASDELKTLSDLLRLATSSFKEVLQLYPEDHENQNTSAFFGILKTFSVAYAVSLAYCLSVSLNSPQKAKKENDAVAERKDALDRRRKAHEERKREAMAAKEAMEADNDDRRIADDLLGKLREGNLRGGRKARKKRSSAAVPSLPQSPLSNGQLDDPALIAQDLLKELHGQEFEMASPQRPQRVSRKLASESARNSTATSPTKFSLPPTLEDVVLPSDEEDETITATNGDIDTAFISF
jgi:cytokinesis protein